MKKEYTVTESAKILGVTRMGLHTSIRQGYLKAKSVQKGKRTIKYVSGEDLREYAFAKAEKLRKQLRNIKLEEFDSEVS